MSGGAARAGVDLAVEMAGWPPPAPEALARAEAEARTRTVTYALGTGEAEEVAVLAGRKPVLRQRLRADGVGPTTARLEALGLAVVTLPPEEARVGGGRWLLFAGPDRARTHAAARCERSAHEGHERELGRLLGYPACCVERFLSAPQPRSLETLARAALARTRGLGAPRLNVLDPGLFHYLPWFPCAFDCAPSLAFADAVAAAVRHVYGQSVVASAPGLRCPPGCRHDRFVTEVDQALAAHRLLLGAELQVSLLGPLDADGVLTVTRAWPTFRDRHPEAPVDPAVRQAATHLTALALERGRLEIRAGRLLLGGEPLATRQRPLLVPFA